MADQNPEVDPQYLLSLETATVHANRAYIVVNAGFTRIALGEEIIRGHTYFRHAVLMSTDDAVDLALTILDLVDADRRRRQPAADPAASDVPAR